MLWIEVLHTLAFHSKWVRLCAQNLYYGVTVLAAAAQCRKTRQGDTTSGGRHDDLSFLHVTALDQSYFFIRRVDFMRYNNIHLLQFWAYIFNFLNYFLSLRITDEGPVPEMRIWSISLIKSDLKWCKHLSRSLFFNCLVWRETWRFVPPRKFMNTFSCLPTNWAINCLLYRKLKEKLSSRKHALNRSLAYYNGLSVSVSETWRANSVLWRHSPSHRSAVPWDTTGRHDVWRETRRCVFPPRDCSRPIIFPYSSYHVYEV